MIKSGLDRPRAGDIVEVEVTDLLQNGQGVGRVAGSVVFVWGPLPGERATVRITQVKAKYSVADLVEIVTPSPDRTEPFCPLFGDCGGCQVQHLSYPAQLRWKQAMLASALGRIGGVRDAEVAPTIGMRVPRAYRNKTALVVRPSDAGAEFGFYRLRSHAMVPVEHCPVTVEPLDRTIGGLWRAARDPETAKAFDAAEHVVVRVSPNSGESVVAITTRKSSSAVGEAAPALARALPGVVGIANAYDPAGENAVLGRKIAGAFGRQEIEVAIGELEFSVSASSFFQINTLMLAEIFTYLRPLVRPGAMFVDLYCGAGTFALFFARCGAEAIGIEEDPVAVREARANAERNGLESSSRRRRRRRRRPVNNRQHAVTVVVVTPPLFDSSPGASRNRSGRERPAGAPWRGLRSRFSIRRAKGATRRPWRPSPRPASPRFGISRATRRPWPATSLSCAQRATSSTAYSRSTCFRRRVTSRRSRGSVWSLPSRTLAGRFGAPSEGESGMASSIDVRYVAKLARIALSDDEVATYGAQLENLLEHVAALERLPTGEVVPTAQVIPARNVMRDDAVVPSLPRDLVLSAAPQAQGPYFRVPRIIAEPE